MIFKSNVFNLNFKNAVGYLTFKNFENFNFLRHGFSTRLGGVSQNEFSSMNLGFNRGDKHDNVVKNYHLFCKAIGVSYDSLVASSQDHNTYIRIVTDLDKGIGIYRPKDICSVDGLLTNIQEVTLVTYYADCVPLFFVDNKLKVIGLAHAGWRGTASKIAVKMVDKMKKVYGCHEKNIFVGIGPSIGPCCYEVDTPVANEFFNIKELNPYNNCINAKENGKYNINLWEVNKTLLLSSGIPNENIFTTDICTSCMNDLLISHRKTHGKRGTMAAMMQLI